MQCIRVGCLRHAPKEEISAIKQSHVIFTRPRSDAPQSRSRCLTTISLPMPLDQTRPSDSGRRVFLLPKPAVTDAMARVSAGPKKLKYCRRCPPNPTPPLLSACLHSKQYKKAQKILAQSTGGDSSALIEQQTSPAGNTVCSSSQPSSSGIEGVCY